MLFDKPVADRQAKLKDVSVLRAVQFGTSWRFHRRSFWTIVSARCCGDVLGASTGAFFKQNYMLVVMVSGADGQTAEKTCGDSTSAVLGQGLHTRRCGVWCRWPDSAENCGYAAVEVLRSRRFPCRAAEAYPHGLACSEDHRDSAVAVRAWWSTVEVPQCSSSTGLSCLWTSC